MSALRTAYRLAALAAFAAAGAIPNAHADDCDKNHYILDEPPCVRVAKEAAIGPPGAVTVDGDGIVYFSSPNIVFKMDRNGRLTRVAGNGSPGFAGDGGAAVDALLNFPRTYPEREREGGWMDFGELLGPLAVDRAGNLYIGDAYNNRVRKVSVDGVISTVVGNGDRANGGFEDFAEGRLATEVPITWPTGVAVGDDGTIFIGSSCFRVTPEGLTSALHAGCHRRGELNLALGLYVHQGIAVDPAGNLLATDIYCRVRKIRPDGTMFTIAGADTRVDWKRGFVVTCGYSGDGGPAVDAAMTAPYAVAADKSGNVFIADTDNHCVRRVDAAGVMSTLAGICGSYEESIVRGQIRHRTLRGGFSGDLGPATEAELSRPHGVAVDTAGNVYIADTDNFRIRKVGPDGIISTVAGNGTDFPGAPTCRVLWNWTCR